MCMSLAEEENKKFQEECKLNEEYPATDYYGREWMVYINTEYLYAGDRIIGVERKYLRHATREEIKKFLKRIE